MSKSINSKFQLKRAVSITVVLLSLSISLTTTTQVIVLADVVNLPIHSILLLSAIGVTVIIVAWKQQPLRRFFKRSNYGSIKIPNPSIVSL